MYHGFGQSTDIADEFPLEINVGGIADWDEYSRMLLDWISPAEVSSSIDDIDDEFGWKDEKSIEFNVTNSNQDWKQTEVFIHIATPEYQQRSTDKYAKQWVVSYQTTGVDDRTAFDTPKEALDYAISKATSWTP